MPHISKFSKADREILPAKYRSETSLFLETLHHRRAKLPGRLELLQRAHREPTEPQLQWYTMQRKNPSEFVPILATLPHPRASPCPANFSSRPELCSQIHMELHRGPESLSREDMAKFLQSGGKHSESPSLALRRFPRPELLGFF